ncbi:uncharacterized protein LOC119114538 [Pollicipes pollicipes]|uniref:uncharacterized protein LOC119114538 n=1 Tax=Pollicipes pollicipes TaxID=41117 RepID=UPI0018859EFF|nr:uncharacterized protein LOC119114538 [Pollicipes pollicipes]
MMSGQQDGQDGHGSLEEHCSNKPKLMKPEEPAVINYDTGPVSCSDSELADSSSHVTQQWPASPAVYQRADTDCASTKPVTADRDSVMDCHTDQTITLCAEGSPMRDGCSPPRSGDASVSSAIITPAAPTAAILHTSSPPVHLCPVADSVHPVAAEAWSGDQRTWQGSPGTPPRAGDGLPANHDPGSGVTSSVGGAEDAGTTADRGADRSSGPALAPSPVNSGSSAAGHGGQMALVEYSSSDESNEEEEEEQQPMPPAVAAGRPATNLAHPVSTVGPVSAVDPASAADPVSAVDPVSAADPMQQRRDSPVSVAMVDLTSGAENRMDLTADGVDQMDFASGGGDHVEVVSGTAHGTAGKVDLVDLTSSAVDNTLSGTDPVELTSPATDGAV